MSFYQRSRETKPRSTPAQTAQLSKNVIAEIWTSHRPTEDGRVRRRIDFSFRRVNRRDGAEHHFRTFRPADVPELVQALAALALSLSKVPELEAALRSKLQTLSGMLAEVDQLLEEPVSDVSVGNGQEGSVLTF
jgi:hypothetical protein